MTPEEFAAELTKAADHHQGLGDYFEKLGLDKEAHFQYGEAAADRNAAKGAALITAGAAK
jgi:hypothetical protein